MDPYIEASGDWGDFHTSLLGAMRAELNARLPRRYRAKIDVFVFVQEPGPRPRPRKRMEPDVFVVERSRQQSTGRGVAILEAPYTITLPEVRQKQKSVLIVDRRLNCVVTVIEVLSPVNKAPKEGRAEYLAKRGEYLGNRINLVEIDLLRGGQRLSLGRPPLSIQDYYILVCRSWQFPKADIWNLSIRDSLPDVPIPLAPEVPETLLPLRACIDRAYDEGDYRDDLDYAAPLIPPPRRQDSAWIRKVLAAK
jgi:hypothetical protein